MKLELGCTPVNLLVVTIGRLDENKNHSMLLSAFAILAVKWPNLDLVIIGNGPLRPRLAALSEELGIAERVRLPGSIPLAARYLKAIDVCTLTSYNEGTPNLIMEAAAAGVASVATNCGDVEYLIEDGVSGFLVPPDDDSSLASYINQLLQDAELRSRVGLAAREKMSQGFSVASMVNRMSCVYDEMFILKKLA
jgi:glycosyltransferase involved in cell wall biosynthesis